MSNDTSRQRKGMWQKLKEKKAVEREHESNFKAGRIPIHERHLHRTGIRGRKRYIYYAFLYLLGILCFVNLVMLCIMLSVLRIDKSGMESMSLFKSGLVRWMYGGDLQKVVLKTGEIGAFDKENLNIRGNNAGAKFVHVIPGTKGSSVYIGPDHTLFEAKNGVRIVSSENNKTVLHIAEREVVWDVPAKAHTLDTTYVVSHRITSDDGQDLRIVPSRSVTIRGNENVFIDSGNLNVEARRGRITLGVGKNNTGMMSFEASNYSFKKVPEATPVTGNPEKVYRLCMCATNQRLFRIEVKSNHGCKNAVSACSA